MCMHEDCNSQVVYVVCRRLCIRMCTCIVVKLVLNIAICVCKKRRGEELGVTFVCCLLNGDYIGSPSIVRNKLIGLCVSTLWRYIFLIEGLISRDS